MSFGTCCLEIVNEDFKDEEPIHDMDIYTAASLGDTKYFYHYLARCSSTAELLQTNKSGWTAMMYACQRGHNDVIKLLKPYFNPDSVTPLGVSLLMLAITSGNMETVELIYDQNKLEDKDFRGWTPLFYAVSYAQKNCVKFLLCQGANINSVDLENNTPLMLAVTADLDAIVEQLLKFHPDLNITSTKDETVATLANKSGNQDIKNMIDEHIQNNKVDTTFQKTYTILPSLQVTQSYTNFQNFLSPHTPNKTPINSMENTPTTPTTLYSSATTNTPNTPINYLTNKLKRTLNLKLKCNVYSPNKCLPSPTSSKLLNFENFIMDSPAAPHSPCLQQNASLCKFGCSETSYVPSGMYETFKQCRSTYEFLKWLHMEKYFTKFKNQEVDFETLLSMTENDLKEIGISLMGPRKKILMGIHLQKQSYK